MASPRERFDFKRLIAEPRLLIAEDFVFDPAQLPPLEAYALYYVCEDVRSACLYRRQDLRCDLE